MRAAVVCRGMGRGSATAIPGWAGRRERWTMAGGVLGMRAAAEGVWDSAWGSGCGHGISYPALTFT